VLAFRAYGFVIIGKHRRQDGGTPLFHAYHSGPDSQSCVNRGRLQEIKLQRCRTVRKVERLPNLDTVPSVCRRCCRPNSVAYDRCCDHSTLKPAGMTNIVRLGAPSAHHFVVLPMAFDLDFRTHFSGTCHPVQQPFDSGKMPRSMLSGPRLLRLGDEACLVCQAPTFYVAFMGDVICQARCAEEHLDPVSSQAQSALSRPHRADEASTERPQGAAPVATAAAMMNIAVGERLSSCVPSVGASASPTHHDRPIDAM